MSAKTRTAGKNHRQQRVWRGLYIACFTSNGSTRALEERNSNNAKSRFFLSKIIKSRLLFAADDNIVFDPNNHTLSAEDAHVITNNGTSHGIYVVKTDSATVKVVVK